MGLFSSVQALETEETRHFMAPHHGPPSLSTPIEALVVLTKQ